MGYMGGCLFVFVDFVELWLSHLTGYNEGIMFYLILLQTSVADLTAGDEDAPRGRQDRVLHVFDEPGGERSCHCSCTQIESR